MSFVGLVSITGVLLDRRCVKVNKDPNSRVERETKMWLSCANWRIFFTLQLTRDAIYICSCIPCPRLIDKQYIIATFLPPINSLKRRVFFSSAGR